MFVARTEIEVDRRLRELYAEDSDWNLVLRDLTHAAVEQQQDVSDFEDGFTSLPDEVTLRSLLPKMSTVVYQAPTGQLGASERYGVLRRGEPTDGADRA